MSTAVPIDLSGIAGESKDCPVLALSVSASGQSLSCLESGVLRTRIWGGQAGWEGQPL